MMGGEYPGGVKVPRMDLDHAAYHVREGLMGKRSGASGTGKESGEVQG